MSSKYNAIAISSAGGANDMNNDLELDGATEYNACVDEHTVNFIPQGQVDPVGGVDSSVLTNLTALPCDVDFENGHPASTVLNFAVYDEMEVMFSGATTVSCWGTFALGSPELPALSTQYATARISSATNPVVLVGESFHTDASGNVGVAAANIHETGEDSSATLRLQTHP